MVSYLIVACVLLTVVVIGIVWAVNSDFVDIFTPQYHSGLLSPYNDAESDYVFDILMMGFKYFLVPAILILAYFAFNMSQKPEQDWRR